MTFVKLGSNQIYYGIDALDGLKQLQGIAKKVFIVMSGDILEKVGSLKVLTDELDKMNIEWTTYDKIEAEPSFDSIISGAEAMKEFQPEWIIGFGGGSAMDAAKVMWVFYENDEYNRLEEVVAPNEIDKIGEKAKLCCIPTSSGTGSEVTRAAIVKDLKLKRKFAVRDLKGRLVPDVAILHPMFTKTMPKSLANASGMDTLTHAIESYISPIGNPFSKTLALGSFIFGYKNIQKLVGKYDETVHSEMLAASCMGGIAFSNSALGIVHSIAHSMGSQYNIPHGLANGIILPYGIEFNSSNSEVQVRYDELAKFIDHNSLYDAMVDLKKSLEIPKNFQEILPDEGKFLSDLHEICHKAMKDVCTLYTPVKPTYNELEQLVKKVYYGD